MEDKLKLARRELAITVDNFLKTVTSKITDSKGVQRETIFVGPVSMGDITHGSKGKATRVDPNPFNATLVTLEGGADVNFDTGEKKKITEKQRCLYIPKFTGFTVVGSLEKNAILTIVDRI